MLMIMTGTSANAQTLKNAYAHWHRWAMTKQ